MVLTCIEGTGAGLIATSPGLLIAGCAGACVNELQGRGRVGILCWGLDQLTG